MECRSPYRLCGELTCTCAVGFTEVRTEIAFSSNTRNTDFLALILIAWVQSVVTVCFSCRKWWEKPHGCVHKDGREDVEMINLKGGNTRNIILRPVQAITCSRQEKNVFSSISFMSQLQNSQLQISLPHADIFFLRRCVLHCKISTQSSANPFVDW
jgi:hypothetical protein